MYPLLDEGREIFDQFNAVAYEHKCIKQITFTFTAAVSLLLT